MSTFNEISPRSKRFFDYLVKLEMDNSFNLSESEQINNIFNSIVETREEYFLENDFIYAEKLKVTRKLIRQRMAEIKKNGGFVSAKGIV